MTVQIDEFEGPIGWTITFSPMLPAAPRPCCGPPLGETLGEASPPPMAVRKRPIRDRLRDRLVDAAVARGADRDAAEAIVEEVAAERPLLDWLMNGGFEKLLDMILKLIGLLG